MQKRGLQIITPSDAELNEWRQVMTGAYSDIRGGFVPEEWFDKALQAVKNLEN